MKREGLREAVERLKATRRVEFPRVRFRGELRDYQTVGATFLCLSPRSVLGDTTGSGKTVQQLAALDRIIARERPDIVLVVTVNSCRYQWQEEAERFLGMSPVVLADRSERRRFYAACRSVPRGTLSVVVSDHALPVREGGEEAGAAVRAPLPRPSAASLSQTTPPKGVGEDESQCPKLRSGLSDSREVEANPVRSLRGRTLADAPRRLPSPTQGEVALPEVPPEATPHDKVKFAVCGWALLRQDSEELLEAVRGLRLVLVLDEVMNETAGLRSLRSQTYLAAEALTRTAYRVHGHSASIPTGGLVDFYNVFRVVRPGAVARTKAEFVGAFCRTWRFDERRYKITGYKNEVELARRVGPYFLRRSKSDIKDQLPEVVEKVFHVDLSSAERRVYDEAEAGLLEADDHGEGGGSEDGNGDEAPKPGGGLLARFSFVQQAADCAALLDARRGVETDAATTAKVREVRRLFEDEVEPGMQVALYTRYERMATVLCRQLDSLGVAHGRVTGREGQAERDAVRQGFLNGRLAAVVFTGAGSLGLNLQAADILVCIDRPWKFGDYEQVIGRVQRCGSKAESIVVMLLCARGTIDEDVLSGLLRQRAERERFYAKPEDGALVGITRRDVSDRVKPFTMKDLLQITRSRRQRR